MRMPTAGEMRTQVAYQERVLGTPTELGDQAATWCDVLTLYARVISLTGNELFKASQIHAEVTVEVAHWYNPRVSPVGRFVIGNRYIYPLSVNGDLYNRFQVSLCKERIGDG